MSDRPAGASRIWCIFRLLLFAVGAVSIFWFFFSVFGILTGVLLFALSQDPRWRAHGFVLSLSAATSEFVAHAATTMEPLHLGMRSGPVILSAYLVLNLLFTLLKRSEGRRGEKRESRFAARIATSLQKIHMLGGSQRRRVRIPLTAVLILIPVGMWASVSIHFGVLFDHAPRMLWVHIPSTVEPGEEFPVTVQAWDAYERLSAVYRGTVRFAVESYDSVGNSLHLSASPVYAELPETYTFTGRRRGSDTAYRIRDGRDNGNRCFGARIDTPGIHYLVVHDSVTRNTYFSNPIDVRELGHGEDGDSGPGSERVYWGDIHSHSDLSDGTGTAAHSFYFARHVARLDFYALTDHGEILSLSFGAFDKLEQATNEAHEPQAFVTLHGVEWTQVKTGHYTCIFSGDRLIREPRLSYLAVPTTERLWATLDMFTEAEDCRALALPHHTTQNSYLQDWTYINPKYVKLAEVSSVHGEFLFEQRHPLNYRGAIDPPPEYVHGSSIVDALRMGKRLILYAAGDEHDGHPGHSLSHTAAAVGHQRPMTRWRTRIGHPYPGGLTAVYARDLTREAVFSALEQGCLFAGSDHGRPLLSFTVNGVAVGHTPPSGGDDTSSPVQVGEQITPRVIEVFLAQDGSPAATRDRAASASVENDWRPDWSANIEIIKNGELLTRIPVDHPVSRIEYVDRAPVTGASYGREECFEDGGSFYINRYSDNPVEPHMLHTGGVDFYIVRVVGRNGRSAYAGPIWVEINP